MATRVVPSSYPFFQSSMVVFLTFNLCHSPRD